MAKLLAITAGLLQPAAEPDLVWSWPKLMMLEQMQLLRQAQCAGLSVEYQQFGRVLSTVISENDGGQMGGSFLEVLLFSWEPRI